MRANEPCIVPAERLELCYATCIIPTERVEASFGALFVVFRHAPSLNKFRVGSLRIYGRILRGICAIFVVSLQPEMKIA